MDLLVEHSGPMGPVTTLGPIAQKNEFDVKLFEFDVKLFGYRRSEK